MATDSHTEAGNCADPSHAGAVVEVARAVSEHPVVIGFDGRAGSGKSTLAALVAEQLEDAAVIHMDDLFPGWDGLAAAPALITTQVLLPLRRGEAARFARFDWAQGEFADLIEVPESRFVLVEGCGSIVGVARPYYSTRVWLNAEHDVRMRRGIERDGDMFAPHWARWAQQEEAMYASDDTAAHADLSFLTSTPPTP